MKPLGIFLFVLPLLVPLFCRGEEAPAAAEDCDCEAEEVGFFGAPAAQLLSERAASDSSKPRLDLFVMSLCPFGMEAQRVLLPLVEQFADQVELNIHYIADEADGEAEKAVSENAGPSSIAAATPSRRPGCAARKAAPGDGPFRSLHGQPEIDESRRQLTALADYPGRYRAYLLCRSRQGPAGDWPTCARAAGLDPDSLQTRALSLRGEQLFRENIRLANSLGVDLSPTLLVDGEEFTDDFFGFSLARRLCRRLPGDARCAGVPACGSDTDCEAAPNQLALCEAPDTPQARCSRHAPVRFSLIALNSSACSGCSTGAFLRTTLELFPRAQVEGYLVETADGAALAQKYGIQVFPAYIFSAAFTSSPRFPRVRHMVRPAADGYLVQPSVASISYWTQRPLEPDRLDLFAPAWELGLEAEILERWPGDPAQVRVHHLLGPDLFAGESALSDLPHELLQRVCVAAAQPAQYPAYVAARIAALRRQEKKSEEDIFRSAGIDLAALRGCVANGRGLTLLRENQVRADSLALDPRTAAALWENRLLMRRVQARQVAAIWRGGM